MNMSKEKKKDIPTSPRKGQVCVGDLCWNPDTGKLEFSFDQTTCSKEVLEHLAVKTPMVIKPKEEVKK
ncbi:MAG: hypothetical protein MUO31_08230 [Thermodesulfovibrionales bacterium]|nr:hypothetical protein [Thermodesulfovibrionales bacterium]